MKNKFKGLGVFGVSLGMWLSRNFGNQSYFGINGRVLIGLVGILLMLPFLIIAILKRAYFALFLFLLIFLPLLVGLIGIYYDNVYIVLGGLIALFISFFVLKRYETNKDDNIDYEKYKKH